MIRMFQTHKIRKQKELEGLWDFVKADDSTTFRLPVPGCWESHPELNMYRGKASYRTTFTLDQTTNIRLEFKGVSHTADVYVNGTPITHHYNAYTPFSCIVTELAPGEHEILVLVDNTFSEASSLHIPNDYYTYGGLIRPVVLEEIPSVYIERLHVTPILADGQWSAHVRAVVSNVEAHATTIELQGMLAGQFPLQFGEITVPAESSSEVQLTVECPDVQPWSSTQPRLYTAELQLFETNSSAPIDDLIERFGFREVKVEEGKILLNGEELVLKGFCRHEDHPLVGAAIPLQLMVQDLDLVQQAGANMVRTTHYPNDERFLDLCDERGIYVWEENHARGLLLHHMENSHFDRQCEDCNREMVQNHFNHPSIIMWGILNECASDTEIGRAKYARSLLKFGRWIQADRLLLPHTICLKIFA